MLLVDRRLQAGAILGDSEPPQRARIQPTQAASGRGRSSRAIIPPPAGPRARILLRSI
jgi:hypothetical protein